MEFNKALKDSRKPETFKMEDIGSGGDESDSQPSIDNLQVYEINANFRDILSDSDEKELVKL